MKKQSLIHEIFWLRSLACLAVTFGHAIHNGHMIYEAETVFHPPIYIFSMAVLFGVPVFVFISEFLLANKYHTSVPKGFMRKRVKILILPYLFMSVVYALLNAETWTVKGVLFQIAGSVFLGKSAVYFILIIFQFYLLHIFCARYLNRWSGKVVIPVAFVINASYLAFFNFTDAPAHAVGDYLWNVGYWMPFVGWLFYFVLGFYGGKNYEAIVAMLRNKWILIIPAIALAGMLLMNKYFMISPDSKRVDMLLYACSVIFSIMFIGIRFQRVPRFIMLISNYSFSIFLLNMFFFVLISYVEPPVFLNIATYSISAFIITLGLCIGTTYVFNQFRFGKYFVGAVMPFKVAHTERYDEVTLRRGLK